MLSRIGRHGYIFSASNIYLINIRVSYIFSYSIALEIVVNSRTALVVFGLMAFLSGNTCFVSAVKACYDTVSLPGPTIGCSAVIAVCRP